MLLASGSGYGCTTDEQAASKQLSSLVDCVDSKVGADTGPTGPSYLPMLTSPSSSKNSREYHGELMVIVFKVKLP